jgi:hypothetical protein
MVDEYADLKIDGGRYILAGGNNIVEEGENHYRMLKDTADIDLYYKKQNSVSITDSGMYGETIDPSSLLYIGGEEILAYTMTHKDGTLFLGNIEIKRPSIPAEIKDAIRRLETGNYRIRDGQTIYTGPCSGCYQ